jgi:hypothetical protein
MLIPIVYNNIFHHFLLYYLCDSGEHNVFDESESNCEYLNESKSNCEYRRKIVNPQILLKRNQCLSVDPFEVFFVNPNSWAAQVHFPRLPRKNISPVPQMVERREWGHNKND